MDSDGGNVEENLRSQFHFIQEQEAARKYTEEDHFDELFNIEIEELQNEDCDLETRKGPLEVLRCLFQQLINCTEIWLYVCTLNIFLYIMYLLINFVKVDELCFMLHLDLVRLI
jgi:transcription elongation factor GreA-like protein